MAASLPAPNAPPKDIDPEDLVALLMNRPRPTKVEDWPLGKNIDPPPGFERVRIIIPPEIEYSRARLAAYKRMKAACKGQGVAPTGSKSQTTDIPTEDWSLSALASLQEDLVAKEMIVRSFFKEDPIPGTEDDPVPQYRRLFHDSVPLEKVMGKQEIEVLFSMFILAEHELGPRLSVLSPDQVMDWVEILKDGLGPLAQLALPDLVELIRGLRLLVLRLLDRCSGCPNQDSPLSNSPNSSEPEGLMDSATSTTSFGLQQE